MRAAHGDCPLHPRQFAQKIPAVQHGRAGLTRGRQFGVVLRDRSGDHNLGTLGEVGVVVADHGLDAGGAKARAVRRLGLVGARHCRAQLARNKRQPAHARSADPNEVESAAGKRSIDEVSHGRLTLSDRAAGPTVLPKGAYMPPGQDARDGTSASSSSAIRSAASGRATTRAAFAIAAVRCGAPSRAATSRASRGPSSS